MNKKILIWVLVIILILALGYLLYTKTSDQKKVSINENVFSLVGETYGNLKTNCNGVKESSVTGYEGAKTVTYNNGYTAYFERTYVDNEGFSDSEKSIRVDVKLKDLFNNYNEDMLKIENLKKLFTVVEEDNTTDNAEGSKYIYIEYKSYKVIVTYSEDGTTSEYTANSNCAISIK